MRSVFTLTTLTTLLAAACGMDEVTTEPIAGRDDLVLRTYHTSIDNGLSEEIEIDAPEGLKSVLIEVRGDKGLYYLTKFQTPSGDLIEGARYTTRFAREVPGLVDWLYPNTPTLSLESGKYKLLFRGENKDGSRIQHEDIEVRLYAKQDTGVETCGLHLDFLVDKRAIDSHDAEIAIDRAVDWVNNVYAKVGVQVVDYQITQIQMPSVDFDVQGASVKSDIENVLEQARAANTARVDAVHLVVVRQIGGSDPAGYAMGLPGPFDADRSNAAVLIATDAYIDGNNELDVEGMASTIAHETGHFLGLYHTSETDGTKSDPLPDTPECTGAACSADFEHNIMSSGGGSIRTILTPDQAFVIQHHPLCEPKAFDPIGPKKCTLTCGAGSTCSVVNGDMQCREACDSTCGNPSQMCKPDDMGTFVCQ